MSSNAAEATENKCRAALIPTRRRARGGPRFADLYTARSHVWDNATRLAPADSSVEFTRVRPTIWLGIVEEQLEWITQAPMSLNARRYADPAIAAAWDLAASAHMYATYGHAGGREEVMIEFGDTVDGRLGAEPEEYVSQIEGDLAHLRKLAPRFEAYRDSWTEGRAPQYVYRLAEASTDVGIDLLILQAADRWPPGDG